MNMPKIELALKFLAYLGNKFTKDRCLRSAAALCYTTLLSLVPLTAVAFSIFAAFPVFETLADDIQTFVFNNFVPAAGEVVQEYLLQFTEKASKLTTVGIIFLILSALLLMNTIEGALNDIWYVTSTRNFMSKFMVYWAVLTLGPVLMGASLAITSYLTSLPLFSGTELMTGLKTRLLGMLPFLATTLACTLMYTAIPNTQVPIRKAVIGALVAATLFELAKKGFAYYVTNFPTYEMVYGALATIPVFLVWVYLSWTVILLGAELTYCLTHFQGSLDAAKTSSGQNLIHNFRVLGRLWHAQRAASPPTLDTIVAADASLDEASAAEALARLERAGLVHRTVNEQWALSKDMSVLTLADLLRAEALEIPEIQQTLVKDNLWDKALFQQFSNAAATSHEALGVKLQPLYEIPETLPKEQQSAQLKRPPLKPADEQDHNERPRIEPIIKI